MLFPGEFSHFQTFSAVFKPQTPSPALPLSRCSPPVIERKIEACASCHSSLVSGTLSPLFSSAQRKSRSIKSKVNFFTLSLRSITSFLPCLLAQLYEDITKLQSLQSVKEKHPLSMHILLYLLRVSFSPPQLHFFTSSVAYTILSL